MLEGHLMASGVQVTRSELRASIHRVDHQNTQLRCTHVIWRRQYSVGFSMAHRWTPQTDQMEVCRALMDSHVQFHTFSVPLSTTGQSSLRPWWWEHCCLEAYAGHPQWWSPMHTDSMHNERIERLWRDVHRCLLHFADTFRELESTGVLDTLNVFTPLCLPTPNQQKSVIFRQAETTMVCQARATWHHISCLLKAWPGLYGLTCQLLHQCLVSPRIIPRPTYQVMLTPRSVVRTLPCFVSRAPPISKSYTAMHWLWKETVEPRLSEPLWALRISHCSDNWICSDKWNDGI